MYFQVIRPRRVKLDYHADISGNERTGLPARKYLRVDNQRASDSEQQANSGEEQKSDPALERCIDASGMKL